MADIIFVLADGETQKKISAEQGETLLDLAHKGQLDVEGTCEGSLACSTCHMIIDENYFDMLPAPSDEEEYLLDLTFGLKPTSRLGCQVVVTEEADGMKVYLPEASRNMML